MDESNKYVCPHCKEKKDNGSFMRYLPNFHKEAYICDDCDGLFWKNPETGKFIYQWTHSTC